MTNEGFEAILRDTFGKIESVLLAKADEYAADGDRLHNFKRAALYEEERENASCEYCPMCGRKMEG